MVYNIYNNEHPKKYFEHRDSIYCLTYFPSSEYLATAGNI